MPNQHIPRLIGAIAYHIARTKLDSVLSEEDHDGAFLVLSDFKPHELRGFIEAAQKDTAVFKNLRIAFPELTVLGADIDPVYQTKDSAVKIRTRQRDGKVDITCSNEPDVRESLGNKSTLSKNDLSSDEAAADIWTRVLLDDVTFAMSEPSRKEVAALVKALLKEGDITLHEVAKYFQSVIKAIESSTLIAEAGRHLPLIKLPLYKDCFSGVKNPMQPSQWSTELRKHRKNSYYLDKRDSNLSPLDDETLIKSLAAQHAYPEGNPNKLSDKTLTAFSAYIEADGRGPATEDLLFENDWSKVKVLFIKDTKTSSSAFHKDTQKALENDAKKPTKTEQKLLDALKNTKRTENNLHEEHIEFFEKFHESIEKAKPKLYKDWEDWVYGKKVECTDFLGGIIRCIQFFQKGAGKFDKKYIRVEALRQFRINDFKGVDKDLCLYFERNYGKIEKHSNGLIRFSNRSEAATLLPAYSVDVLASNERIDKEKAVGASAKNKRTGFEFRIILCETVSGNNESQLSSKQLVWNLPADSILKKEREDIRALVANRSKRRSSATVLCTGAYNTVGQKGTPLPLSLAAINTFDASCGAKNEGSFVPAQNKIITVVMEMREYLDDQEFKENLTSMEKQGLLVKLDEFDALYTPLIHLFEKDSMDLGGVPGMVGAYTALLDAITRIDHQSLRKSLIKYVSRIGTVQIDENARRPTVSIICPWHPLRLEAWKGRRDKLLGALGKILRSKSQSYSDGSQGKLHFEDLDQTVNGSLYPEISLIWNELEATMTTATSNTGSYTLHEQPQVDSLAKVSTDNCTEGVNTIVEEVLEYVRLQPHEKDNLSLVLYNCESREMPQRIVEQLDKRNEVSVQKGQIPMNCEVVLTHQNAGRLQDVYKNIVAQADSDQPHGKSEGFLSKVRINISALTAVKARPKKSNTPHADIVYCKDLFSSKAKLSWSLSDFKTHTSLPEQLHSHRWNRQIPFKEGNHNSSLLLCCPNQSEAGWHYIKTMTTPINGVDQSVHWPQGKIMLPIKYLDIDESSVKQIIDDSHQLGVWVVSQDEMLDRRLLEEKQVKVIRYIQSVSRGRNLIISSTANDALLRVSLRQRLSSMLGDATEEQIGELTQSCIDNTNAISGGLILKAARRTNSTNELFGMVLTKFLITGEIGESSPICWCSLDDFSKWLGKPSGEHLADLLVLAPSYKKDGSPHLDVIVTEAKFIKQTGDDKKTSAKQLRDTLKQISRALSSEHPPLDQGLWLARISDMILSRLTNSGGQLRFAADAWRSFVRKRECSFSVWGYSHVFVYDADTATATTGVEIPDSEDVIAQQETFNSHEVMELFSYFKNNNFEESKKLRLRKGHTGFGLAPQRFLRADVNHDQDTDEHGNGKSDGIPTEPVPPVTPSTGGENPKVDAEVRTVTDAPQPPATQDNGEVLLSGTPMEILSARSKIFSNESADRDKWLAKVIDSLKMALRAKGMSSKLSESRPAVLTPNAAIVTFEGGPDLTVKKLEDAASELLTTYGIDILRITPGLGIVSMMVTRPERQKLQAAPVFEKLLTSSGFDPDSEAIMIGVREEDGEPQMLDPFVDPHTLVSGATGSGKSVLLQSMLLYIGLTRSPESTHVYLVDGKSGVDYFGLKALPHLKAGSGGIVTDKGKSAALLEELVQEMEARYKLFEETGSKDIRAYRKKTGDTLPTVFYLQDEFAEWMLDKEYAESITQSVSSLGIKSRAAGIFMTFGLQRPDNTVMPMQLRSQLGNRLTLKVSDKGTAEIATGDKNSGAERLLGKGHMLAKLEGKFVPIQVPLTDPDLDLEPLVKSLARQYKA